MKIVKTNSEQLVIVAVDFTAEDLMTAEAIDPSITKMTKKDVVDYTFYKSIIASDASADQEGAVLVLPANTSQKISYTIDYAKMVSQTNETVAKVYIAKLQKNLTELSKKIAATIKTAQELITEIVVEDNN